MLLNSNQKIKICHVASADMTIKFLLFPQLKFLQQQGYDVHVVCSKGNWKNDIEAQGIKVKNIRIRRRITPFSDLVSLFQLFLYFKKEKFQIVHTHTPKPGLLGQLAARIAGIPIVINTVHGLYFSDKTPYCKRNFYTFIEKVAGRCSSLIFSQNRQDMDTIITKKIADAEKIRYLGNGTDIQKFNSKRFSEDFINNKKLEMGLNPKFKIVGTAGRLVQEKGYFDLFSAFKKVLEKFPETMLLVIGPEDREKGDAFSPEIVRDYGIENNVIFLGERTDIDELYSLMDVFILASWREGFPRTVIEAMAMERPIITTDIRGCKEAIDNNKNGILIPPKTPKKLAEAIIFMLTNTSEAERMAKNARGKAKKEFNEELVFSKIKEQYLRLSDKRIKICHVATVDITVRFILWDLIKFLKREDYDVSIVCSQGKWMGFFKEGGFPVHNIKMLRRISPVADLMPLIKLYFLFRKERFDIVHTHTPKAGFLGRIAARLAGVPVVVHSSHGFHTGIKIDPIVRMAILSAEKVASYFCDMVTFLNKEDVEFAIKKRIVSPEKIKFLTYGIDIERFDISRFGQNFTHNKKKELGLENKRIIGMVGRFVGEKGYSDLFEAFKIVKAKEPDVALLLVAPPDKAKDDALDYSILKDYGIEKDTVILGSKGEIDNMEEVYSLMDIFVLPSYREGLPYSIMEASSSSKPVIATDIRGCRDSVENGVTGILVPLKNPGKLSDAIVRLLSNPDEMKKMAQAGRKKAEKDFDERIFFDKMEKEYDGLIKKKLKRWGS